MPKIPVSEFSTDGLHRNSITEDAYQNTSVSTMLYIGIDPGVAGGLVALGENGMVTATPMPTTERDIAEWLKERLACCRSNNQIRVFLEQQIPRPTFLGVDSQGRPKRSILKSTCLLYGHYTMLRGMLIAFGLPFQEVLPQAWMKELGIATGKKKKVADSQWKDSLRGKAQQLCPQLPLWSEPRTKGKQLAIADAVLIALFCQRKGGKL